MSETSTFNLSGAQLPDNTIDFYTLLNESPRASTEELRSKIGAVYSEAQANRDHRNLTKRREYQALLELLPPARAALLEEPKRARYDDYLAKAKDGTAPSDFETFINDLMGFNEPMEEKTGLLGVQEKAAAPRARVIETNTPAPSKAAPVPRPAPSNRPVATPAPSSAPARKAQPSSGNGMAGAIGGFVLGALVGFFLFKHAIIPAILLGIVLAAVAFVFLNMQGGTKVKR